MKRFTILLAVLLVAVPASAQEFGPYKGLGGMFGASHLYRGWKCGFDGEKPPQTMFSVDINLLFFFVGFDVASRNTGYDVYGYNESVVSRHVKFGASLQYVTNQYYTKTPGKFLFCPYVGFGSWNVRDSSGNDIGARTNYGEREKFTSVGINVIYRPRDFPLSFGLDVSTRTAGLTLGFLL